MTIFAIIAPGSNAVLQARVKAAFPKNFEFSPGQFVAAEAGITAAQASEKISVDGSAGLFVVFSISSHFGWHKKELWEWLTVNASG